MRERIRRARPDEADALTALATYSKAHWGYDAGFMERIRDAMTLSPQDVEAHEVWVLEDGTGRVIGFHRALRRRVRPGARRRSERAGLL